MGEGRIVITAPGSGSGKTVITCGILQLLKDAGYKVAAGKCGPDYIDPMFHREVIGTVSRNFDAFFSPPAKLYASFLRHSSEVDITVIEGVMGYYDGMTIDGTKGSTYEVAKNLGGTPVVMVLPCKGMACSSLALLKGFLDFRQDSNIQGIILNRVSKSLYPRLKEMIEENSGISVVGYVPEDSVFQVESRHLGLVTPDQRQDMTEQMKKIGEILKETIDIKALLEIAYGAPKLKGVKKKEKEKSSNTIRIAVARDEAFNFYYPENLELLESMGAELVEFSPLSDQSLPHSIGGLILGGGYPEEYGKELSGNWKLRKEILEKIQEGLPCLGECGGFLYLHQELEGSDGEIYPMVGVIPGRAFRTNALGHFGYIHVIGEKENPYLPMGEQIKGHEFHYWDTTENGSTCLAKKPNSNRSWSCVWSERGVFAGFPHLYYPSNKKMIERYLEKGKAYYEN
ncbi:cobyrinic acid a,c-diamide synthase [Aequitasia blattaphilus]|uniref:Cobyrinate a,c-diamide synthase n=1 Tax=Aequitasia blattaphilus TaxID=2949332 RepID=A0ABT1E8L6_9FIRM|nr:cobyrinate a,c-diamide synthase [Aequitasia blattaphilus]MCP1102170.1 cobyrinate a,c-diamide synthase [Aequitasia blattaphilus]MCR8614810.1 cobyrinate a,c-diamide synthase [Aequitasia blattaphilus]